VKGINQIIADALVPVVRELADKTGDLGLTLKVLYGALKSAEQRAKR